MGLGGANKRRGSFLQISNNRLCGTFSWSSGVCVCVWVSRAVFFRAAVWGNSRHGSARPRAASPYDTVERITAVAALQASSAGALAAANRRLPMTGHGSATQTRSKAQLLPPTSRHVIRLRRTKRPHAHTHQEGGMRKRRDTHLLLSLSI